MPKDEDDPFDVTTGEKAVEVVAIALNAVPIAGGVMSGIAEAIISKRQNRRLNEFLVTLAENLKSLEARVNAEFLRTEDFQDLAEAIFSKAAETRQEEKLDAFRAIFLNTVLSSSPTYDEAAEITELVDSWQSRHIILVHILADPVGADAEVGNVVGPGGYGRITSVSSILQKLLPGWSGDQVTRTWKELYSAQIHRTPDTGTMISDQGINQLKNRLTEFGVKVARYLTIPR